MIEPLPSTLEPGHEQAPGRIEVVDMTEPAREEHPLVLLGVALGFAYLSGRAVVRAVRTALWHRRQEGHAGPLVGPYRS